ncbi:MAG: fasciclin domain-containing protein, partial [Pseudomonadota bacterium]
MSGQQTAASLPTIAEIATGNDNFDILVAALDAAGLVMPFTQPGSFTVFAPTDAAFRELASTTLGLDVDHLSDAEVAGLLVETLTLPTLTNVLLYHVAAGAQTQSDFAEDGTIETLFGETFQVAGDVLIDKDVEVENPEFVPGLTDLQASNGIVQVIDRVLLPLDVAEAGTTPTIADIAGGSDAFEALTAALIATGLDAVVADRDADFTVFAPTDDAFRQLAIELGLDVSGLADADLAGALVDVLGADLVTNVLLYHVAPDARTVAELQGDRAIDVALPGARVLIDGDAIVDAEPGAADPNFITGLTDIEAANGRIQAIDRVLLPLDLDPVEPVNAAGGRGADVLQGGAADDHLAGGRGADVIAGGEGDDAISGGGGRDILFGDGGDDHIAGGSGRDSLFGGAGDDTLAGGSGRDEIDGGAGNDYLTGGFGRDAIQGGDGHDNLHGGRGADTLDGGAGDDYIAGGGGRDLLIDSAGNDIFAGGSAADT